MTSSSGASLNDLIVLVVVVFVLLTGLDFLGAGHHSTDPSIGAATAPETSRVDSPRSPEGVEAER